MRYIHLNTLFKAHWGLSPKVLLLCLLGITLAFVLYNFSNTTAAPGINKTINFQGKVVNSDGTNVADGSYDFEFKIYTVATSGTAVWTETWDSNTSQVTVTDGIFRVALGTHTALPGSVDFDSDNIYLGINYNGDGEMLPRVRFTSVAQAFNASMLGGAESTQYLRSDESDSYTAGTLTLDSGTSLVVNGDLSIDDASIALTGSSTNFDATGNISFNTDDLFIQKSSGNVGIGTTTPSSLLHVSSGGTLPTVSAADIIIAQRNAGTGNQANVTIIGGTEGVSATYFGTSGNKARGKIEYHHVDDSLRIGTSGSTDHMRITSSGNIGIGTTSPLAPLSVKGSAFSAAYNSYTGLHLDSSGVSEGDGNYGTGIEWTRLGSTANTKHAAIAPVQTGADSDLLGLAFFVASSSSNTDPAQEVLRIVAPTGKVGIGTTAPTGKLDIAGDIYGVNEYVFSGGSDAADSWSTANLDTAPTLGTAAIDSWYIEDNDNTWNAGLLSNRRFRRVPGLTLEYEIARTNGTASNNNIMFGFTSGDTTSYSYNQGGSNLLYHNATSYNVYDNGVVQGADYTFDGKDGSYYRFKTVLHGAGASHYVYRNGKWNLIKTTANNSTKYVRILASVHSGHSEFREMRVYQENTHLLAEALEVTGTSTFGGDLLPSATNTYSLGSDTMRWKDLYLSGSSLHIGASGDEAIVGYDSVANLFTIDSNGNGNSNFVINSSGNVGIGTTSPSIFKLQVAGNVGPNVDNTYDLGSSALRWKDLYLSGDLIANNLTTYNVSRALPTVANDYIEIGNVHIANGAHNLYISVTVPVASFSVAKQYMIPIKYDQTSGAWQTVMPISDTGVYSGDNFALDINVDGSTASLRLRRTSGTTAGTAYVRLEDKGAPSTFAATTTTGTTTEPTAYFSSTSLTQINGNVGIGTTSPDEKLDVEGTSDFAGGSVPAVRISDLASSAGWTVGAPFGSLDFYSHDLSGDGAGVKAAVKGVMETTNGSTAGLAFFTENSTAGLLEKMRISANGNVGIGTASPTAKLDVAGTMSGQNLQIWNGDANPTLYTSGGNVGIGITSPSAKLDVAGTINATISQSNQNANVPLANLSVTGTAAATKGGIMHLSTTRGTGTDDTDLFRVFGDTSGTSPFFTIRNTGNVGIGTTNPTGGIFHVVGQCVTGDTRLRRRRRRKGKNGEWEEDWEEVPITDIKPGDDILSLNEDTGEFVPAKVNNVMDMGEQEVFELVTATGKKIRTTGNHPYLALPYEEPEQLQDVGEIEVDQSTRFEELARTTSLGFAGNNFAAAFEISSKNKRQLDELFRRHGAKKLAGPAIFAAGIVAGLKHAHIKVGRLTIDNEYTGYNALITAIIESAFPQAVVSFKSVGKSSKSHHIALPKLRQRDVTVTKLTTTELTELFEISSTKKDRGKVLPRVYTTSPASRPYAIIVGQKEWNVNSKSTWTEVRDLTVGQHIAVVGPGGTPVWEQIKALYSTGREQTYDIEIEGTRNFVGNDIVAHNTYLGGNLEVTGTTTLNGVAYTWPGADGSADNVLTTNGAGALSWQSANAAGLIDGSGSTNYIAKFSDSDTLTSSVIFDDGTNVGIGTTSPGARLSVDDTVAFSTTPSANGVNLLIRGGGIVDTINSVQGAIGFNPIGRSNPYAAITSVLTDNDRDALGLAFYTSPLSTTDSPMVEAMRITHTGKVGIGTTSPTAKLDVAGTMSGQNLQIWNGDANPTLYTTGGKVGIGTSSPYQEHTLTVKAKGSGNDQPVLALRNAETDTEGLTFALGQDVVTINANNKMNFEAGGGGFLFNNDLIPTSASVNLGGIASNQQWGRVYTQSISPRPGQGTLTIYSNSTSGDIAFNNYTSEMMRVTGGGNVGIGTTGPGDKVHVSGGDLRIENGGSGKIKFGNGSTGSLERDGAGSMILTAYSGASGRYIDFAGNSTGSLMRILTDSGNVGIGTTDPDEKLHVAGNLKLTGTTTLNSLTYTWPGTQSADGLLTTDGSGNLTWGTISSAGGMESFTLSDGTNTQNIQDANTLLVLGAGGLSSTVSATDTLTITLDDTTVTGGSYGSASEVATFTVNTKGQLTAAGTTSIAIDTSQITSGTLGLNRGGTGSSSFTNGSVIFSDGSKLTQDNDNFFWDDSNNRLGIGTTSPAGILDITKDSGFAYLQPTAVTTDGGLKDSPVIRLRGKYDSDGTTGITSANYNFDIKQTMTAGGTSPISRLGFLNNAGTEVLSLLSSGNVGIGTTSPGSKFSVLAGSATSGLSVQDSRSGVTAGDLLVGNNTGAGGYVTIGRLSSNSNDNTVFRIRNRVGSPVLYMNAGNGNLGIGTSSPGYKLDVQSYSFMVGANNSDGVDRTDNTNKTARMFLPHYTNAEEPVTMFMAGSTATDNYINYGGGTSLGNSATSLRFLTAANGTTATGTERMRIDSVGNVGIGTTSPGAKLEIETGAAATKGLIIQGAASQSANLTEWQNSAGTVKALVNSSGDFSNTGGQTNGEIFGAGATVTAAGGTALGYSATAGNLAVAIGDATASGIRSIAVSNQANASGNDSIAMGLRSAVSADYGIAIGRDSTAAMDGLALGRQSTAGLDGIALGRDSTASAQAIAIGAGVSSSLVSIGQNLTATGTQNVLLGIGSSSSSNRGIAIGNNAVAGGVGDSLSIGLRATSGNRSIALGRDSTAGANAIAFGESATAADNELAIKWASGVGVIQGDANGNVGIGTGSPGAKLVVKGSGTSSDTLVQFTDSGDTPKFTIWDNGTTTIGGHVASDGGAGVLNVAKSVTDGNVALVIANSTQSTAGSLESASLEFKLRRGGGDGLDVAGGKIVASRLGAYGSTADRDSSLDFYTVNNDSQTMKMRIDNVGNVGIGTTSPSQALDLVGALKLENTTSSTTGVIYKGGSRFIHNFQHPTGDTAVPDGFNTFVGIDAGNFTMGSTATSIGQASYNTGVGYQVLNSNTTGNYNVASGYQVLNSNTTGAANVASGYQSLYANTTGNFNVASGFQSLYANTTGGGNIAIGSDTLKANTTGNFNIATGYGSLLSNTTGSSNIANGFYSMFNNTTGSENIAIGVQSLNNNTTGRYNIAIGGFAGGNINPAGGTDGANSLFGYSTGLGITTGINNTILGANVTGLAPGLSNNVILADGAGNQRIRIDSSGQVGIGTTSPSTTLHVAGDAKIETISAGTGSAVCFDAGNVLVDCSASSIAYKTDVNSMTTATDEVMQMRPVTFKWKENGQEDFGFIAQEMAEVNPLYATFKDGEVHGVHYSKLTSVIVKAMQEQNQRITTLEEKVAGMSDTQITIDSTDNILSNDLTFSGAMTVDNNLTVTKDMTVKGIMTLYSDLVVDTVHVAKALNVHGDVNIFGKLVVDGDVEVKGRLSISEQQAGMAAIPPGEVEVEVTYKQAYEEAPLIQVTPQAATNGYWISKQTAEGFSISLTETTSQGVTFNWVTLPVLASEEEELDEVVENNETPVAEETAPEEVVVEEEKISIKNTGWFNGDNVESLRVREDATVASTEITTVASGDTFVYTETKDGWYLIEIEEGVSGWVSAEYVEEVEAG